MIITGMHRSGTSFAANWLGHCGLDLGPELIGATPSNKLGHFEDKGILEFHEDMLRYNGTTMYAGQDVPIRHTPAHLARARELVAARNARRDQWGWKQPRACLFFPLWREAMPGARYFLIYRDFQEIISSLYNREYRKIALRNPPDEAEGLQEAFLANQTTICNGYLSMWIRHNQEILDHLGHIDQEDYLLVHIRDITDHSGAILDYMAFVWGFDLNRVSASALYNRELIHKTEPYPVSGKLEAAASALLPGLERARNDSWRNLGL